MEPSIENNVIKQERQVPVRLGKWFWGTAIFTGISYDFLFWLKKPGINFPIFVIILISAGIVLSKLSNQRIAKWNWVLIGLSILTSAITLLRAEGFTRFVNGALSLMLLSIALSSLTNGYWTAFRLSEYIKRFFKIVGNGVIGGGELQQDLASTRADTNDLSQSPFKRTALPIIRGLFLSLPILLVLGGLLAAADPIFEEMMLNLLKFEKIPEYLIRTIIVIFISYLVCGLLYLAIFPKKDNKPDIYQRSTKPFIGWIENTVIFTAVNILFISFLAIQFQYLFGGSGNITTSGYTYSEYARRGFFELIAVALISIVTYLTGQSLGKAETKVQKNIFTALSSLLLTQVIIILISSWTRLALYENAYGYTQLRIYTHVFIVWLGILLIATILFQLFQKQGYFGHTVLAFWVAFAFSLAILNVDGLIFQQNLKRAIQGEKLDVTYLVEISEDVVPVLFEAYQSTEYTDDIHDLLGYTLACRTYALEITPETPYSRDHRDGNRNNWQSYHPLRSYSDQLLSNNAGLWSMYELSDGIGDDIYFNYNNENIYCFNYGWRASN
jgi:hypothetical protein